MATFARFYRKINLIAKYNRLKMVTTTLYSTNVIKHPWLFYKYPNSKLTPILHSQRNYVESVNDIHENIKIVQNCWKCGKTLNPEVDQFKCGCGVLQLPVEGRTFFQVMDVDRSFKIKTDELTTRFRELQSILHPDKFSTKSQIEKQNSEAQASLVNIAYKTLLKPVERGLYMLSLHGEQIGENEVQMDSSFLMDIMEKNEEVDSVQTLEGLKPLEQKNSKMIDELLTEVEDAFSNNNIVNAKSKLAMLKYFCNIETKIKDKKQAIYDK